MSAEGTFWAWKQDVKPASAKLVLLCLGDCHNDRTGRCDPSAKHIAKKTGLNEKTVRVALKQLEEDGYIVVHLRPGTSPEHVLSTHLDTLRSTRNRVHQASDAPPDESTQNRVHPNSGTPENGYTQNRIEGLPNNGQTVYPISGTEPTREPESNLTTSCAELSSSTPAVDNSPVVLLLPTNRFNTTREEYRLTQRELSRLAELYPAVDALQTARKACAWLIANEKQRKTAKGIPRFLNAWFSREHDRAPPGRAAASTPTRHSTLAEDLSDTSWASPAPAIVAAERPQVGGFQPLRRLQELYDHADSEAVIFRWGGRVLALEGLTEDEARGGLLDMIESFGTGPVLDALMVTLAGGYGAQEFRSAASASCNAISKDWVPAPSALAELKSNGIPEDLCIGSRAAFVGWFSQNGIRHIDWPGLFVQMCTAEWSRVEGSRDQYSQNLAAAAAAAGLKTLEPWRDFA